MRLTRHAALPLVLAATTFAIAGCPDDPTQNDDLAWTKGVGAQTVTIDATSEEAWIYFSFAQNKIVTTPEKPEDSTTWDLALRRYNFKTNGGSSGKGKGAVADLGELDQKTTDVAKVAEWVPDAVVEDSYTGLDVSMSAVLSGWYSYHFFKHELLSTYHLYAVRAADGTVATLKVYSYYDDAGTAGHVQIVVRYPIATTDAPVVADGGSPADAGTAEPLPDSITDVDGLVTAETNLDARAGKTFFSFEARGAVTVEGDPKASTAWDLAFDDWLLTTNSGTSGGEQGGALLAGTSDFAQAASAPTTGWIVDDVETIGSGAQERHESTNSQLAGWFDFDPSNQHVRSKNDVVWLRTASGKSAKLQIVSYYDPAGNKRFYRLRWAYRSDGGTAF